MEIKPNIYKGFCGDLRLFFDPDMYTIEDFRNDYLVWKEARVNDIEEYLENFITESKSDLEEKVKEQFDLEQFDLKKREKKLDKITEIRIEKFIQKLKEEKMQGYQNFYSLVLISSSKFLSYFVRRSNLADLDEHYKQFITGQKNFFYHYIGADGNKYFITDDAVYLANKVIESLLRQSGTEDYDDHRLTSKVRQTEKINGFVNTIFKNEVEQFFHRRPAAKSGYERNLIIRTKSILRGNLTKSQKKYMSENGLTFHSNLDNENISNKQEGFALDKDSLDWSQEDLESIQSQMVTLVSLISLKPKVSKPSAEKSSIRITEELSKSEKEKKLYELIHIESKWKVFSGVTLVEIMSEAAKELGFVRIGVLNEAFKQALYVNQYDPSSLLQTISIQQPVGDEGANVGDFLQDEELENTLDNWIQNLISSTEYSLSPVCEDLLNDFLENLKDEENDNYEIFINYFQKRQKVIQSNIEENTSYDSKHLEEKIEEKIGKEMYIVASKILKNITKLLNLRQSELNNEKIEDITIFAGITKYMFRSGKLN